MRAFSRTEPADDDGDEESEIVEEEEKEADKQPTSTSRRRESEDDSERNSLTRTRTSNLLPKTCDRNLLTSPITPSLIALGLRFRITCHQFTH